MSVDHSTSPPLFPAERPTPFDPPDEYMAALAAGRTVSRVRLWSGAPAWLVTGYDEARTALSDPRFSADMAWPNFPILSPQRFDVVLKGTFLRLDGAEHARIRRMLTGEFTARRLAALRPRVEAVVGERLAAMAAHGAPADLVRELAQPVPSLVICELLGTPKQDQDFFQDRSRTMIDFASTQQQAVAAADDLRQYLATLVAAKAADPGDDLLSRLLADRERAGLLDRAELVSIAWLLLLGGHETTANMIALGVFGLLCQGAQWAALTADATLVPGAVEEMLRHLSILHRGVGRVAVEPLELGGQRIEAGDGVLVYFPAANRDPARFPDAERLDVTRDARGHIGFGHGAHQCVGQALARIELVATFTALTRDFPTLRLATPPERVPMRDEALILGLRELPVAW